MLPGVGRQTYTTMDGYGDGGNTSDGCLFQDYHGFDPGDLPIVGATASTDVDSCDSESSCSVMTWNSLSDDIDPKDLNDVMGDVWVKLQQYRRK